MEQLSHKFYMSESAIGTYIKKTTGLSFFDLINEMRIGRTMNYLLYTDLTLEELWHTGILSTVHISASIQGKNWHEGQRIQKKPIRGLEIGVVSVIEKVYYEIVAYIYRHYAEDLESSDLSRKFGDREESDRILLYQRVEMTFHGYLNYIRVNKACRSAPDNG